MSRDVKADGTPWTEADTAASLAATAAACQGPAYTDDSAYEQGVAAGLQTGVMAGYAVGTVMAQLTGGKLAPDPLPGHAPPPHGTTTPTTLRAACDRAIRDAARPLWLADAEVDKLVVYVTALLTFEGVPLDSLNDHLRRERT